MSYISSIIKKYGDVANLKQDVKYLNDILARQGASLLLDVIAESLGNATIKFKLTNDEVKILRESIVSELNEAILERT